MQEWLDDLDDEDPSVRLEAARKLTDCCTSRQDAPFDEVLEALGPHLAFGPDRERDREVLRALRRARRVVARERIVQKGSLLPQFDDLAEMDDAELSWRVIEMIFFAADIHGELADLQSVLSLTTPGQRAAFAIHWTQSEVRNGGFGQYFHNSTGMLATEALEAFRRVGLLDFASILERAMALFPGGTPPSALSDRRARLEQIDVEAFTPVDEDFDALLRNGDGLHGPLADYIRAHPDEFFEEAAP